MVWRTDSNEAATVKRYDSGLFGNWEQTPQGGIKVPAFPTRSGVFPYRQPDGTTRLEYRPPDEVFRADSLASLANAPVTYLHPEANGVRIHVTPANWAALAKGHVGPDVHQEGDHVASTVLIQDQDMIAKVMSGQVRELSCGYDCKIDPTPGVSPAGQKYDVIQRGIVYNHLAGGPAGWGRAGPTVALRADSGDAEQVPEAKDKAVEKETIDGVEYVVGSKEWAAAVKGQRDKAMGRADAADKALKVAQTAAPDPKVIAKAAAVRAGLLVICDKAAAAKRMTFDAAAAEAVTNDQLVIRAIQILDPTAEVEGKSPEYLAGVLDTLAKSMKAEADEDAAEKPPATDPAQPPPAPGQPPKTDGKDKTGQALFKAREGAEPPKGDAKDKDKTDAARFDSDVAEAALVKANRERGTKPLVISRVKG